MFLYKNRVIGSMKVVEEELAEIILQPTRFKIARHLVLYGKEQYIEQIADSMQESPRLVSHHLAILEDLGLVESRFDVIKHSEGARGKAARFFKPTAKLTQALSVIKKSIPS